MGVELDAELLEQVVNPWLLGADPEFAVLDPPEKLIPNAGKYATEVNCLSGAIGQDHGGRVWEVRPMASPSAYGVVLNIWKLLCRRELERVEAFKWKGGALGAKKQTPAEADALGMQAAPSGHDTLGGHVHFGISQFNPQQRGALDKVTTGLLNLEILPTKENTVRLSYGHYGRFTRDAVRDCNGHVEYRCAPSWLDRPGQAFATLTTYKLAAARPSLVVWPSSLRLKQDYLQWLAEFAKIDVDAFLLDRYIGKRGLEAIQADPDSNFRPRWRKEELWAK